MMYMQRTWRGKKKRKREKEIKTKENKINKKI